MAFAPVFLTLDEVLALHADQIGRYGGKIGVRDLGLLQSALATPAATFGGDYLHATVHEMAAAHLFHLVKNHPFVDGNKRIGLIVAIVFLGLNGQTLDADPDELVATVLGVADGSIDKPDLTVFLKTHIR